VIAGKGEIGRATHVRDVIGLVSPAAAIEIEVGAGAVDPVDIVTPFLDAIDGDVGRNRIACRRLHARCVAGGQRGIASAHGTGVTRRSGLFTPIGCRVVGSRRAGRSGLTFSH